MRQALAALLLALAAAPAAAQVAPFVVTGDAVEAPLTALRVMPGAAPASFVIGETANCLICHTIPDPRETFMGEVGPPLAGVALRLTPARCASGSSTPTRINGGAVMPAYHRTANLLRASIRASRAGRS